MPVKEIKGSIILIGVTTPSGTMKLQINFLNEVSIELNGLIKFYIFELFIREHKKQDQSLAIIHFIKYN